MKKVILCSLAFVSAMVLTACGGGGSSNTGTTAASCVTTQTTYNAQGQAVPTCVGANGANPYGTNGAYPYGTTGTYPYGYGGYGGSYGGNPCAQWTQIYGAIYMPTMLGGQLMCVLAQ